MVDKRSVELEDLYRFVGLGQIALSPDQEWVAFVRTHADKATNAYVRNLWVMRLKDAALFQLTRTGKDGQPAWLPDSQSLLFVSSRQGKPQLYRMQIAAPGGEPYPISDMINGVSEYSLSPDGKKIAFLSPMSAVERAAEADAETPQPLDEKRFDPRVVLSVPYRSGTTYISDQFPQIYVADLPEGEAKITPRRLTDADAAHKAPQWSADGKRLFTDLTTEVGADEPGRRTHVHVIDIETGGTSIVKDVEHVTSSPKASKDGRYVAYERYPHEMMSLKHAKLSLMDALDLSFVRDVDNEIDRAVAKYIWAGQWLYVLVQDSGLACIHRIPADGEGFETVVHDEYKILDFDVSESGEVVFAASKDGKLQELYRVNQESGQIEQLTHFNEAYLSEVNASQIHPLTFEVDGREIQGWYLLPVGYEEGQQYPLVINVHGGPHIMWGAHDESKWHEWQIYAANGYAVFFCNPRGSGGYGNAFQEAVFASWGDAMRDVLTGVDLLIDKGIADPDSLFLTGGSYGGYLTTWMISHSDRFKAAVSQRGVYNLVSFFGTTDIPSFLGNEFGYTPLEDTDFLWKHSPIAYVNDIHTPLLIMHSENDFRVPISEAEQLFGFMRKAGKSVEFVRYPREGHELSRSGEPEHRIDRIRRILHWFNRHLS